VEACYHLLTEIQGQLRENKQRQRSTGGGGGREAEGGRGRGRGEAERGCIEGSKRRVSGAGQQQQMGQRGERLKQDPSAPENGGIAALTNDY
jgi:hypothetical protein